MSDFVESPARPYLFPIITLALFLAIFPGCGAENSVTPNANSSATTMSLDVGNSWSYQYRSTTNPGSPILSITREITEKRTISYQGKTVEVAVKESLASGGKSDGWLLGGTRLLRNEAEGLVEYNPILSDPIVYSRQLLVPADCTVGQTWDLLGKELWCVATDSTVTTVLGGFQVDVFEYLLDEGTITVPDVYVIPEVGLTTYYSSQYYTWMTGYDFGGGGG